MSTSTEPGGPGSGARPGIGSRNTWIGEAQSGAAAWSVEPPQALGTPAVRITRCERDPLPPRLALEMPALPLPRVWAPACSSNAPSDSPPTRCVARAHSGAAVTCEGVMPDSRSEPDTVVVMLSEPLCRSSPASVAAPSGSLVYRSASSRISTTSLEGVVRCHW